MSKKKWFDISYHPYIEEDSKTRRKVEVFRPTVPIAISYQGKPSFDFQALVDSGSDRNLFPAGLGESVGIAIKSGRLRKIQGIGKDNLINAYTHKVKIIICSTIFDSEADFSYEQQYPLLGRDGFFSLFDKVGLREQKKSIEFRL